MFYFKSKQTLKVKSVKLNQKVLVLSSIFILTFLHCTHKGKGCGIRDSYTFNLLDIFIFTASVLEIVKLFNEHCFHSVDPVFSQFIWVFQQKNPIILLKFSIFIKLGCFAFEVVKNTRRRLLNFA